MSETPKSISDDDIDPATLKQRSTQGAATTLVVQGVKFVLKFGSTVVMARLLTPAEFGIVAMAAPILGLVSALNNTGFSQAIIGNRKIEDAQINSLFWVSILISFGLFLTVLAVSPLASYMYKEPQVGTVLSMMASLFIINNLSTVPNALLSRKMRFLALNIVDLIGVVVSIFGTLWAAWAGFSFWSLVMGQLAGAASTTIMAFVLTGWRPNAPRLVAGTGKMVRFGANLTGVNVAGYLSMTADNIIVGAFAGKVALGLYDRSYTLVVAPLGQLIAPLHRVAVPLLVRLREDPALYRRAYTQMLDFSMLLTLPAMLFCITMAKPFILFLWGERWAEAIPLFILFSVGGLVAPIFSTTAWLFISEGRTGRQLMLSTTTAMISIASFVVGINWGVVGVVMANAITFVLLQTPLMMWGATKDGIVKNQDFVDTLLPLVIPSATTAAALVLVSRHVHGWTTVPILGATYALFGIVLLLMPGGRHRFTRMLGLLRSLRTRSADSEAQLSV